MARITTRLAAAAAALLTALWPLAALAQDASTDVANHASINAGVSGLWVLANLAYAGQKAQGNESRTWRIISFIFGLPGTLITLFAVREGSERAYGVDLPRRQS